MKLKEKRLFYSLIKKHPLILNGKITVSGNSMFPTLVDGDVVEIYTDEVENINIGDIIVYSKFDTHLTVHRVVGLVNRNEIVYCQTKGDGNAFPDDYLVSFDDIIGKINR